MKRINVYITEQQCAALYTLAEATGRPVAEVLRQAIDVYLAHTPRRQDSPPLAAHVQRMSIEELRIFVGELEKRFRRLDSETSSDS